MSVTGRAKKLQDEQIAWWQECARLVEQMTKTSLNDAPYLLADARRIMAKRPIKLFTDSA